MAAAEDLLLREVSELCIGKPPLRPLPATATIADALRALKRTTTEPCLSVWSSDGKSCLGKVCMADVVCYLCSQENFKSPATALKASLSELILNHGGGDAAGHVVYPNTSVLEALDLILDGGAQHVVVHIRSSVAAWPEQRRKLSATAGAPSEYCWLTQEDFARYFLNSIFHFSPLPSLSVSDLNLVSPTTPAVLRRDRAISILPLLRLAAVNQTSIAVLDDYGRLSGDISPSSFSHCDETVVAAVAALSAGELTTYLATPSPSSSSLFPLLRSRLSDKKLDGMLELLEADFSRPFSTPSSSSSSSASSSSSSSSSDEESNSRRRRNQLNRRRSGSYYSSEGAIVCQKRSSLVAVMVQALAHRVNYVWVVDEDHKLAGIVPFAEVLRVLRDHLLQQLISSDECCS